MHLTAKVEELPRLLLWIARVEVGEQLGVRQVPQAGAVVSHGVGGARDVVVLCQVSVVALVEGCQSEQVGCRSSSGGGPLAVPVQSRGVVGQVVDGVFPDVGSLG